MYTYRDTSSNTMTSYVNDLCIRDSSQGKFF